MAADARVMPALADLAGRQGTAKTRTGGLDNGPPLTPGQRRRRRRLDPITLAVRLDQERGEFGPEYQDHGEPQRLPRLSLSRCVSCTNPCTTPAAHGLPVSALFSQARTCALGSEIIAL